MKFSENQTFDQEMWGKYRKFRKKFLVKNLPKNEILVENVNIYIS